MKTVSLKELKSDLGGCIDQVSEGETLEITRYNRPVAYLTPVLNPALHPGIEVGKRGLVPATRVPAGPRWRKLLDEDRRE